MHSEVSNSNILKKTVTSENTSGYRSIFKATSVFGGVQVFNILVSLVKGKVLAVLIGTAGMGLNGLLHSSLNLIKVGSSLGLGTSAVREISAANHSKDDLEISRVYTVFKRWIWFTAILGVIITIAFSPLLSRIAYSDGSHTHIFFLLSITFIFGALSGGINTLLRGIRKIKELAKANVFGSVAGLLLSIPIFYYFGIEGVVPAIIVSAIATYLISLYFRKKVNVSTTKLTLKETFVRGKQMVSLGVVLTLSTVLTNVTSFALNAYISKTGSLQDVGIYSAGQSIMAGYVGMIFIAMSNDYYPRLSEVINKPEAWKNVVNQQAEIILLILGPILTFILFSAPLLIRVILSAEFLPVIDYMVWASLAVMLQGMTWIFNTILISKADNRLYLFVQMASQAWALFCYILFYKLLGIKGLGIAMALNYLLSVILLSFVIRKKYGFTLSRATYRLMAIFFLLLFSVVGCISFLDYPRAYYFAGATFIIVTIISIFGLNKRMDLFQYVRDYIKRSKKSV